MKLEKGNLTYITENAVKIQRLKDEGFKEVTEVKEVKETKTVKK